jgi:hypothetical protein
VSLISCQQVLPVCFCFHVTVVFLQYCSLLVVSLTCSSSISSSRCVLLLYSCYSYVLAYANSRTGYLTSGLLQLPRDVLRLLFRYVDLCTLVSCRSTCKWFAGFLDRKWVKGNMRIFGSSAALSGYLNVLQWAWAAGFPCRNDVHICPMAAYKGHLQLLQWARENACPGARAFALPLLRTGIWSC